MKLLSWNVRGLTGSRTRCALGNLLREHKPVIVFLMETNLEVDQMISVSSVFNFSCFVVGRTETGGGGLALLWESGWNFHVITSSIGHIDGLVSSPDNVVYRLIGFYGHPSTQLRSQSWELLRRISSSIASDWFVFGDFNEILFVDEKNGRRVRPLGQILRFRAVIEECGLTSVPFEGYPFTWSNGRVGEDLVEERIDRGFANFELMHKYSHIFCSHLIPKCSDHRPLLFQLLSDSQWTASQMRKRRRFQFEEVWVSDNACQEVIKHSWALSKNSGANICDSIQNCASALSLWGTQTFGSINFQLRQVRRRLDAAYSVGLSQHNVSRISQLESQLSELQDKEEVLWRQRSRITWLQLGDRNTRFFHERASGRTIHGLFDSQGIWQTDSDVIGHLFCDYFAGLFTKIGGILMERVLSSVLPLVSPEMNTMLLQPFERKDLEFSLFRMQPSKSPGVDGMSALFFQRYWSFIGDEVSTVCLQILNGSGCFSGVFLEGFTRHSSLFTKSFSSTSSLFSDLSEVPSSC
ncbi:hypothetical protein M0R45_035082 [Rubus argutus]|uniref:Endonuclease/exonuclease/phosphatase domain-containing protein n=1 Tax=Rubus argutus TaxID=59490 RepID=A0AAW1VTL6_RUBAR